MKPSNWHAPTRMSPAQRRTEAAVLLTLGLRRLPGSDAHTAIRGAPPLVGLGLGFQAKPRVHANPVHRSPQA